MTVTARMGGVLVGILHGDRSRSDADVYLECQAHGLIQPDMDGVWGLTEEGTRIARLLSRPSHGRHRR
ncbi:hypothetical protein D2E24_1038 [Bifidobacterium samirii]|uniref:Uncharacterized protein n=1 Tax=Bifidobacterium samirii TaxID=2306974 RepID=A0A430FUD5_9BIFI|nr:hypothetical protein D2E24_1038 [Bifidobacterium samirii]